MLWELIEILIGVCEFVVGDLHISGRSDDEPVCSAVLVSARLINHVEDNSLLTSWTDTFYMSLLPLVINTISHGCDSCCKRALRAADSSVEDLLSRDKDISHLGKLLTNSDNLLESMISWIKKLLGCSYSVSICFCWVCIGDNCNRRSKISDYFTYACSNSWYVCIDPLRPVKSLLYCSREQFSGSCIKGVDVAPGVYLLHYFELQ